MSGSVSRRARLSAVYLSSIGCALYGQSSWAQTPYQVAHSIGAYAPLTSGTLHTPVAYSAFDAWDEGSAEIELPFAFTWYGRTYTKLYAYTNGFVSFDPPPAGGTVLGPPLTIPQG